jgi:hypothetical protein
VTEIIRGETREALNWMVKCSQRGENIVLKRALEKDMYQIPERTKNYYFQGGRRGGGRWLQDQIQLENDKVYKCFGGLTISPRPQATSQK